MPDAATKRVFIIGLPNSGKSQIFSNLTGEYTLVANYPLSTIAVKKASYELHGTVYEVFDTPGIYSLAIQSEEGVAVGEMLFAGKCDIILQCIDANLLKQSLRLSADLTELGIPMVIALNAVDESARKGIWIDSERLSKRLGIPVIESIAVKGVGTNRLKQALERARVPKRSILYGDMVESSIASIEALLPDSLLQKRKAAVMLLAGDHHISEILEKTAGPEIHAVVRGKTDVLVRQYRGYLKKHIVYRQNEWIDDITLEILKRQKVSSGGTAETIARACRNVHTGIPILFTILLIIYFLVVDVANSISDLLQRVAWKPMVGWLDRIITSEFVREFLIGQYGLLTLGISGAILSVLPILSVFFIVYHILEDMGYIPNLSVLSKRVFKKIGLSGAAILPMVVGFGCKTMATLMAKTIPSRKERIITIFLIAFAIPCAPQIGLSISMLGRYGIDAFMIFLVTLFVIEAAAGLILKRVIRDTEETAFIQALPPIRMPNPLSVLKKTSYRIVEFLEEALPVFVYASIVLFTLQMLGILQVVKSALAPVVNGFMGLPTDIVEALMLVMATRSASAVVITNMAEAGKLDFVQGIVAITLTTIFFPCFANIGAMVRQTGVRNTLWMVIAIAVSSVLISGLLYHVLRYVLRM